LPRYHLLPNRQAIDINTRCHAVALIVARIPDHLVRANSLLLICQRADLLPQGVKNFQADVAAFLYLVGNQRRRIKRIRVVLPQV
jgi:hypothetical protein